MRSVRAEPPELPTPIPVCLGEGVRAGPTDQARKGDPGRRNHMLKVSGSKPTLNSPGCTGKQLEGERLGEGLGRPARPAPGGR